MTNNTTAGFRLSTEQERLWTQQRDGTPYIARCLVLLEGPLRSAALEEALAEVVRQHEILRTTYRRQSGLKVPFQIILDTSTPIWNTLDLSSLDPDAQQNKIDSLMQGPAEFNLQDGPILQASLAKLSPSKHALILTLPALAADSRSLLNLVSELGRTYATAGSQAEVMQYVDIVQWQTDLLESDETKAGRDFWRDHARQLDIASLTSITLPQEAKTDSADFLPRVLSAPVAPAILHKLDAVCAEQSVTLADLLLASFAALLGRITNQPEVLLGCNLESRKFEELEQALGLFAKYVPLQIQTLPELPFTDLLSKTKAAVAEANQWQEGFTWTPFETSGSVAFPLSWVFDYAETGNKPAFGDISATIVREYVCRERSSLRLAALRTPEALTLEFHYDASRLNMDAVDHISSYFGTLLATAIERIQSPLGQLALLPESERHQLLVDWNATSAPYPKDQCLHQLFEAQAERTPDRPALRFNDQSLTYRELNEQSNQLAHYLRTLGIGPDSLVGLCLDRSTTLMVALLGILKAGGAYIPLNTDTPAPRLAQQLISASVLITEQSLLSHLPEFAGKTVCVHTHQGLWANQPRTNPSIQTTPENTVYILYTSGSTGTPKGVAVRHRNLINYAHFITQRLDLNRDPQGLNFATVSTIAADLGNTCIFPSLISGGCLHLISYDVATDAESLSQYNSVHPIDVLKIVPSHLQALLHSPNAKHVLPRRYLILGGEALTPHLLEKIQFFQPSCEVLNHYGPTETTVGSLTLLTSEFDWKNSAAATIPIGRPIANTQVYLLDAQQQLVPLGVTGELYVAGDGVTAGYLNDPARTAEKFLPDPFVAHPAARMYRTGDLARYLPDGNIEFLGRSDDQVKIRGFRVELGEIESLLIGHPSVKQAVVLVREQEDGDKRLLAYVILKSEASTSAEDLRTHLKQQLPEYMVPAAIVLLPRLPLTPNGKVDRQALPEPELVPTTAYVAPHTPTEEVVASIWSDVLRRDRISTLDNFFEIGGHSLLATQIISRIRRVLNVDLPLKSLFEAPTVAGIAQHIDDAKRSPLVAQIPPMASADRNQDLPLSFAQQRLWVLDQMEPNNALYNIPRRVRMRGELNVGALTQALNEIVRRHESQRTTFSVRNGQPIQVIAPTVAIHLVLRDLTNLPEESRIPEARRIAEEEALIPFDLATGPLLRATLAKLATDDHILLLTMHHIVSDAWSAGVFFQEFSSLYESFNKGRPSQLPELAIQYADYAAWQRKWFQGDILNQQLAYWREHLRGAPSLLQLPTDRPRGKAQTFSGTHETIFFSPEIYAALKKLGRQEGTTLFMTLLAGFQTLLFRYSGQEQIVLGTDVANRTTTDTERMIGFFINLLAIRTDLSGNPTFRELLGRVREVALGAYAHQEMPFDKLVEELQPERSLSHNPIVQALFVMQNIPRQRRELAGLTLEPFELPITRSKFDLAVFMVDGENDLSSHWIYSTDLFDRATILRIARHFETLLGNAVAQPDTRIGTLEMLSEEEKLLQDSEKKQKKESQLKKLMTAAPKAVNLPQK